MDALGYDMTSTPVTSPPPLISLLQWPIPSEVVGVWNGVNPEESFVEGPLAVNGNLWNTAANSVGSVVVSFNSINDSMTTSVNFSDLYAGSYGGAPPAGYPNVSYGQSPYGGANTSVAGLELPKQVSAILQQQSLELYASYSIQNTQNLPIDMAYDTFLTQQEANGTSHGPTSLGPALEVMIWLDQQNNIPPAGTRVATNFPILYMTFGG